MFQFDRIFSVKSILASRGFSVSKCDSYDDTLLSGNDHSIFKHMYEIFNDTQKRQELQKYLETPSDEINTCGNAYKKFVDKSESYQILRNKFSTTFEWFVGQLLVHKFEAFSASFGVVIDNVQQLSSTRDIGDYDVLAVMRNLELMYLECKMGSQSSNGLQTKHIRKAMKRGLALHTLATVLFLEKGVVGSDIARLVKGERHPVTKLEDSVKEIQLPRDNSSGVYKWFDCYFINSSPFYGNVLPKIRTVLRSIAATSALGRIGSSLHASSPPSNEDYQCLGYVSKVVNCS